MTSRFFAAAFVAIIVGLLVPGAVSAQSGEAPRTAWDAPDLQGVWDFRSLTPMERPEQFADNEVLTSEEAAAFSEEVIQSRSRDSETSDRAARAARGDIIPYNDFWFDEGTAVTGDRPSLIVDPPDGQLPEVTTAERQRLDALAMTRRGVSSHEPTPGGFVEDLGPGGLQVRCILGFNSGPPMEPSGYNNNVQLLQTEDYVVLLNEMVHDVRVVPLDGRPQPARGDAPVEGRLARALGRRHARRDDHQFSPRDELPAGTSRPAPHADRALHPRRRRHAALPRHCRRPHDLDTALDVRGCRCRGIRNRSTNTPATRATTGSTTSSPARARRNRNSPRRMDRLR